jgi:hypothetical protein
MDDIELVRRLSGVVGDRREIESVLGLTEEDRLQKSTTVDECKAIYRGSMDKRIRAAALKKGEKLLLEKAEAAHALSELLELRKQKFRERSKVGALIEEKIAVHLGADLARINTPEGCFAFLDATRGSSVWGDTVRKMNKFFENEVERLDTIEACDLLSGRVRKCEREPISSQPVIMLPFESMIRQYKLRMLYARLQAATTIEECADLQALNGVGSGSLDFKHNAIRRAAEILRATPTE